MVQVTVPIKVAGSGEGQHTCALIDLGEAGNFISLIYACDIGILWQPLSNPVAVLGVNGEPLQEGKVSHRTGPVTLQVGLLQSETLDFWLLPKALSFILGHPILYPRGSLYPQSSLVKEA